MESWQKQMEALQKMDEEKAQQLTENMQKGANIVKTIIRCVIAIPILLVGLIFFAVGMGVTISEQTKSQGYEETTGVLSGTEYSSLGGYVGIYSYTVNGNSYEREHSEVKTKKEELPASMVIKYDPRDPAQSVVKSTTWLRFAASGMGIVLFALVILFWPKVLKLLHLEGKLEMHIE